MATTKISFVAGEEANLDGDRGMAAVAGSATTGDIDVTIDYAVIGRDEAIAGLVKITELVRKNSYPLA